MKTTITLTVYTEDLQELLGLMDWRVNTQLTMSLRDQIITGILGLVKTSESPVIEEPKPEPLPGVKLVMPKLGPDVPVVKVKRKMSVAGRKAIQAGIKRRWAAYRKAQKNK